MRLHAIALLATTLFATSALAVDVSVESPWVRGTVPAQKMSGAFMAITSKEGATLVGASSPIAAAVEVHEMKLEGGIMKMRATPRLALPAGKTVTLKPGGYHIMLMDLQQPLKPGDTVLLTLKIENAKKQVEDLTVNAEVRALTAPAEPAHDHNHMH